MSKSRIATLSLSLLLLAPFADANATSVESYKCPDYPPNTVTDSTYEGSLNVTGLKRLADAEIKGKVQTQVKKFTANNPDANQTTVLLALLAYNCRAIQKSDLPENKKSEAREKFNRIIVETLTSKKFEENPHSNPKKSPLPPSSKNTRDQTAKPTQALAPAPSLVLVAQSVQEASRSFKGALRSTYMAALGGAYIHNVPYDFMLDDSMLEMASKQNFMDSIPNVVTIPRDAQTSLAYDMCTDLVSGENIIQKMFTLYNSRVPESLIQDIQEIRETSLYQYFSSYVKTGKCSVFLGKIKYKQYQKQQKVNPDQVFSAFPIPSDEPKFSAEALKEYLNKIKKLDTDSSAILSAATLRRTN